MVDNLVPPISLILIKQEVGFYLHREGPNLGKHLCPLLPVTISLDAQIRTPYPRSAGFDTDRERAPFFFFFFFLDLLPRWEKGFPSGPWLPWRGRGESPSEIGSVSLSLSISALPDSTLAPFLLYVEICNSDWGESFTQIFLIKLAFLRQKKSVNRLTGCP